MLALGLIGYGTIGKILADAIHEGKVGDARLVAVHDLFEEPPFSQECGQPSYASTIEAFLQEEMDVVNEAASQAVLGRYAGQVLDSGRDLIVMSVGALADSVLLHKLTLPARQRGCRLLLPAGAIGGLDVLAAAALDEI